MDRTILICSLCIALCGILNSIFPNNQQPDENNDVLLPSPKTHCGDQSNYDDEFNNDSLNLQWSWSNENPSYWSLTTNPGHMRLTAIQGNIWDSWATPTKILKEVAPDGNFTFELKQSKMPSTNTWILFFCI